jgi:hypothetical protein
VRWHSCISCLIGVIYLKSTAMMGMMRMELSISKMHITELLQLKQKKLMIMMPMRVMTTNKKRLDIDLEKNI